MRLLDKQEIQTRKSAERKLEVDEGMKLAKTVDKLRQAKSDEELNLRKFRDKSMEIIKDEIKFLTDERDMLSGLVVRLREEKMLSESPIDLTEKWNKVNELESKLGKIQEDISLRELSVIQREASTRALEKELFEKEEFLKENKNLTEKYLVESKNSYDESEKIKLRAKEIEEIALKQARNEENRLRNKESELIVRERDLENEKNSIEQQKLDINNEKLHIASQQETLRTAWNAIKRLQK